ncbi:SMP-30/gluconolactonase/LRE family protein [bacterium]|nr:SMP-30/gluconolactonase/LRE family protein [bacterium]
MGVRSGKYFSVFSGLLLVSFCHVCGQNLLKEPESVVFDAARNRYLVSNKGDGKIIQIADGAQSVFNADQVSIRGLHILGDSLYAACNAGIAAFNLSTGTRWLTLPITGQNFLNDITSGDASTLYVSDSGAGKIYKVNPLTGTFSTLCSGLSSPNGLYFDKTANRILVCYFRANSPISAVNPDNGTVTQVAATSLGNLDGIAEDGAGRFYVSSWSTNAVYRFNSLFSDAPEQVSSGHNGPADIYYNKLSDILAVPNMNANTLDFISFEPQSLLDEPASVVFDSARDRYLVSGKGNGNIVQIKGEEMSLFASSPPAVRGLHILGNTLYAAVNTGIAGFDLNTGAQSFSLALTDPQVLHDIDSDGIQTLYVTDTPAGVIYAVNVMTQSVTTLAGSINMPQGLLYDGANNRLLVSHYLNNAPISAVSLSDGSVTTLVTTPFFNLDGLARDNDGRIYAACRGNHNIYRYNADLSNGPDLIDGDFSEPADIGINLVDDILAVPNTGDNTVAFIEIEPGQIEPPIIPYSIHIVTNTLDSGAGSLRQAVLDATQHAGPDSVIFNIPKNDVNYNPATGVWTITLSSMLQLQPDSCTVIDANTQKTNQGETNPDGLQIELSGGNTTDYGFWVVSASNVIKGLTINRFTKSGIILISASCTNNKIEANHIGTDADGRIALPNQAGIEITNGGRYNRIGRRNFGNLISGNQQWGIVMTNTYVKGNTVIGNKIGTDMTGLNALGNGSGGILVGYHAYENVIGPANVISGTVNAGEDLIGNGITIIESHGNRIVGNDIGTNIDRSGTLGNAGHGIAMIDSRKNTIGGMDTKDRNVISGNSLSGILIKSGQSDSNMVMNNCIGANRDGAVDLGNLSDGVLINQGAHNNTIGGYNIIVFNGRDGVRVDGTSTLYNTITSNSISRNTRLGINNVNGGNEELGPPIIVEWTAVRVAGSTFPGYTVEIYSDEGEQGRLIEGIRTSATNGTFSLIKVVSGPNVTATVTDVQGNTSEFSRAATSVENSTERVIPDTYELFQNTPNPFNPLTTIMYRLPESGDVSLIVYDIMGKIVKILVDEKQDPGTYRIVWKPGHVSSGVYLCHLKTERFSSVKKLIIYK